MTTMTTTVVAAVFVEVSEAPLLIPKAYRTHEEQLAARRL
jgi:hypothetical protein